MHTHEHALFTRWQTTCNFLSFFVMFIMAFQQIILNIEYPLSSMQGHILMLHLMEATQSLWQLMAPQLINMRYR